MRPSAPGQNSSHYRRDIDGLRALAILPVLLFHASVPGVPGGYVGVDIFFVISGYLITGIIARQIDGGRFSMIGFYERRARRILPALCTVTATVLACAAWLYLPGDFEDVPRSALAALLFAANVYFFFDTGYFQGGAETKPMLHSWSLGIEEQFYIGFPILLLGIHRYLPRHRIQTVAAVALISFGLALATQTAWPSFAFYLLPPRAWELFAGALLALGALPAVRSRFVREIVSIAGLAAIAVAILLFDRTTVFPGAAALLPVLGAAAIIHTAPDTHVGRLLSAPPLVGVGLISYSLYLWHWPLIVFLEYWNDGPPTGIAKLAVIAASVALATFSWRFVERPFRDAQRFDRPRTFITAGASLAFLSLAAFSMTLASPWPGRFAPEVVRLAKARSDVSPYRARCHDTAVSGRQPCILGAPVAPTAVVWGDSHGVELAFALSEVAAQSARALVQHTQSSCPPVLGYDPADDPRCARVNRETFERIRSDRRIGTVFLAAFWANTRYRSQQFDAELDATIARLVAEKREVVLIGPIPPNAFDVPRHLAHLSAATPPDEVEGSKRKAIAGVEVRMRAIARHWRGQGVRYVEPAEVLCPDGGCIIARRGVPLYFDSHHLSVAGVRLLLAGSGVLPTGWAPVQFAAPRDPRSRSSLP